MPRRICLTVGVAAMITVAIYGCSTGGGTAAYQPLAHKALNAVCAGSLKAIDSDLNPTFKRTMPDFVTAGAAAALQQQCGAAKTIQGVSSRKIQLGATQTLWSVTAERGTYDMRVGFDSSGKVNDIAFKLPSKQTWETAMAIGANYVKKHGKVK